MYCTYTDTYGYFPIPPFPTAGPVFMFDGSAVSHIFSNVIFQIWGAYSMMCSLPVQVELQGMLSKWSQSRNKQWLKNLFLSQNGLSDHLYVKPLLLSYWILFIYA
jgi:hypothetical protein